MGANYSGVASLKKNEYLERLADEESINENDPFWNQLLSFNYTLALTKDNSKLLDESVSMECQKLHQNNLKSGNFGTLIKVFCKLANEAKQMTDNHLLLMQTSNALLLIRCFTKYIIEIENEHALLEQINTGANMSTTNLPAFSVKEVPVANETLLEVDDSLDNSLKGSPTKKDSLGGKFGRSESQDLTGSENDYLGCNNGHFKTQESTTLFQLISCLFELCTRIRVEEHTYYLHLELLNTFIVLLSVQMYTKLQTNESFIYSIIMTKMENYVSDFIKTLLNNLIQQMPAPANLSSHYTPSADSLMTSVTSGLWSVMTLGYGSSPSAAQPASPPYTSANKQIFTYLPALPQDSNSLVHTDAPLDCSSRLLAWQSCHILLILSNHCTSETLYNPYRLALFHFTDTIQDVPATSPSEETPLPWFSIEYSKLFQMFTYTLHTDQYTLLLYMLMHRNQHFKMFLLSRINIDLLIVPIMKVIYTAPERNSHHIYMALIILLILSEDDFFNKAVHNIPLKKLTWYTERSVSEISLGGLLILVIIRTIQFNMTRMRDKYLHTNCLAALANMSSKFYNLHPYVCQRINSLFSLLAKKRVKIINLLNSDTNVAPTDPEVDYVQDLAIIEELMRMVLEIINSCLTNHLHHNSNLIYSILYNKSLYTQFRSHPTFQDVMQNIDLIITSFSNEVDNTEDKSIEKLKELIEINANKFPRDRFKKFPELKFKYVEEDQPEEFFVPYVWSLVYKFSSLYWVDHTLKLFNNADKSDGQHQAQA